MGAPSIFTGQRYDDRSLIESILTSYFIVDYGFITAVNGDKTVNVTHAKTLKTLQGENLPDIESSNVEVLTLSGKGFSINFDYDKGDRVLLLGLKDYVEKVDDVSEATENTVYCHYSRETMKALPLCAFDDSAKVTIQIEKGEMKINAQKGIEIKSPQTKLTGGIVEIGGAVAPEGQGALCGVPYCLYTGAPHSGSKASGT